MISASRIWILLRTRLGVASSVSEGIAALLFQAVFTAVFCGLVRDGLPPFPYGVFVFSLMIALIGIPLLGELGYLLRHDSAKEWVGSLAIRPAENRLARMGELLWIVGAQALACGLPAALLAPVETEWIGRLAIPFLGLGMAISVAASLLCMQSLLGGRAEGLFILVQTLLVGGVIVGGIVGLGHLDTLARLPELGDEFAPFLWLVPPAWFAAPLAGLDRGVVVLTPFAVTLSALVVLAALPPPAPVQRRGKRKPLTDLLLAPVRYLAERFWVSPEEHGGFLLVYEGLPREREVVLRTYPMLGIPLAFGALAASHSSDTSPSEGSDLMAILLFTVGIYLPVLLTQVPTTESPLAAWLHRTAPVHANMLHAGAIKALVARFLIPLYVLLGILAWFLGAPSLCARLLVPAFLTSLFVLRRLYPICVRAVPMSVAPDEIENDTNWLSVLGGAALVLTLVGVLANRMLLREMQMVVLVSGLLLALEIHGGRRLWRGQTR